MPSLADSSVDPLPRASSQRVIIMIAGAVLAIGAGFILQETTWRLAALWLVGAGLGFALYHAAFGFTGAYRVLFTQGRSASVRAQMLMLAVAVLIFFPLIDAGSVFGNPVRGFVFPAGVEVAIGAFLFGIGMQLGGGCASGALYTAGGGNTRMLITLVFFIVGMTIGAYDVERWEDLPALPPISLPQTLGLWPALLLNLGIFALIAWLVARREKRLHGGVEPIFRRSGASFLTGPWPFGWAALALALLNVGTLILAGRPWGITQAFATWGSLVAEQSGLADPVFWTYWDEPTRVGLLHRSPLLDATTLMNVGLMLGALLAAGLAGRFAPVWRIGIRPLAAAIIGGLILGYGARMAFGCNISAYFSGVASGSVHGWLWIAAALPGNYLGILLRPLFGLEVERRDDC
jgi:uncharacterized membrane protein YedE/YeeE